MDDFGRVRAQEVADQICAEAGSGSAYWDELNGPDAKFGPWGEDGKFVISLPGGYDDDGPVWDPTVKITIEEVKQDGRATAQADGT